MLAVCPPVARGPWSAGGCAAPALPSLFYAILVWLLCSHNPTSPSRLARDSKAHDHATPHIDEGALSALKGPSALPRKQVAHTDQLSRPPAGTLREETVGLHGPTTCCCEDERRRRKSSLQHLD